MIIGYLFPIADVTLHVVCPRVAQKHDVFDKINIRIPLASEHPLHSWIYHEKSNVHLLRGLAKGSVMGMSLSDMEVIDVNRVT